MGREGKDSLFAPENEHASLGLSLPVPINPSGGQAGIGLGFRVDVHKVEFGLKGCLLWLLGDCLGCLGHRWVTFRIWASRSFGT